MGMEGWGHGDEGSVCMGQRWGMEMKEEYGA